jgi:uncharacterized protein (TIGR03118 family)
LPLRLELLETRLVPSDGTGAGTTLVKDFVPGSGSSTIYFMGDLNGTLLASVEDGGSGYQGVELYRSDGTAAGTTIVAGVEALSSFTVIGNTAYFSGEDATTPDFELFKTDGTTAGTVWINPRTNMSHPGNLANVNGTLFFSAYDPAHGFELWKSDGTPAGTVMVKDIDPGSGSSSPVGLTNVNGTLFFVASDGTSSGSGLWKSDGTAAGTVLVKGGLQAQWLTAVNGKLFFSGNDGKNGSELWGSDGTATGTQMVKDIYPGTTMYKGHSYYGHGGFHIKVPNSSSPASLTNVSGTLYFTANDGTHGRELWKSDGTSKGTMMVADISPSGADGVTGNLANVSRTLFFEGNDGAHGWELWKSDGTAAGTVMVKDINPTAGSFPSYLTNGNGTLYFTANDGTNGMELWKSDGTASGTVLVKDINAGSTGSYPELLTVSGGHLFFTADDGVHGRELWDPPTQPSYQQINLVGYQSGMAPNTDPNLNGWGMDYAPNGPFCVADTNPGVATFYDRSGAVLPQVVTIPAAPSHPLGLVGRPTGVVYNPTSDFVISENGVSAPAEFLFDARDGTISGWNPAVDPNHALIVVDNSTEAPSRADYTGLVIAQNSQGQNVLYAADFHNNKIDMFDGSFHSLGSFSDSVVPAQYPVHTAWQVEAINGQLWVTYGSHKPGPYGGVVDIFDTDGHLLTPNHFTANAPGAGPLENPWGIVQAPANFGAFSNDILIGNVEGAGNINAFDPVSGAFLGSLQRPDGTPIANPGLWDLTFGGNTSVNGLSKQLYFDAGPNVPNPTGNGLFGRIIAAGNPQTSKATASTGPVPRAPEPDVESRLPGYRLAGSPVQRDVSLGTEALAGTWVVRNGLSESAPLSSRPLVQPAPHRFVDELFAECEAQGICWSSHSYDTL